MDRFLDKVEFEPNSGCWLWTGWLNHNGYGYFWDKGKNFRAHRVAFEHWRGKIPDGLELDHLCRVRCCVNPDHLEPVTRKENFERSNHPWMTPSHCKHGHPFDEQNTYFYTFRGKQHRACRTCKSERQRKRKT